MNKEAKMQNELTDRDLPGLTPQAARQAFEALATRCGWDLAQAHGDGVTRWLDPMTRDLYLAWLEGHASADVAFTRQALVIADGTAQDLAREVAALRKRVKRLTPYVEAFRREEARADKAERAADDALAAKHVPEAECEAFIAAAVSAAPEPLRVLGEYLSRVLNEDHWLEAERLLLGACAQAVRPLTDAQIHDWWASENGLEDCDLCKLHDFAKVVRALQAKQSTVLLVPAQDPYDLRITAFEAAEVACDDVRIDAKNRPGANACIVAIRALIQKEVDAGVLPAMQP